ncbi:MAG: class I SAM-dependent methyltransferase [Chloroflexota bacterium]|nr:class I SAM-dependent methyltransferase [Chloroflexota bacterium]
MSANDRARWDTLYSQRTLEPYPEPDPLLFHYTLPVDADGTQRALDLAGGQGQNALWLAEQGYTVDLMDISRIALRRAQDEMTSRELRNINFFQVDFDQVILQPENYDLICVFRFLSSKIMPQVRAAVRPGGRIIYETFNSGHLKTRPDFNPDYLLQAGELVGYFADWRILHAAELSATSQVVAVKPE